jgi:flagellar biosynthesis regulator FlaF
MTLRKGEDTLIWKRKLWIALYGDLALEEALGLS